MTLSPSLSRQQNSQFQSRVRLDRDIDLDSEAYLQRRRDAIDNFERGGVEVAPAHYRRRDVDASTISDSYYFGSRHSIELQGYISSSQAPDSNSYYESSDCRVYIYPFPVVCLFVCLFVFIGVCCLFVQDEDGDSVYSQARYQLPAPSFMGEVTVVSSFSLLLSHLSHSPSPPPPLSLRMSDSLSLSSAPSS